MAFCLVYRHYVLSCMTPLCLVLYFATVSRLVCRHYVSSCIWPLCLVCRHFCLMCRHFVLYVVIFCIVLYVVIFCLVLYVVIFALYCKSPFCLVLYGGVASLLKFALMPRLLCHHFYPVFHVAMVFCLVCRHMSRLACRHCVSSCMSSFLSRFVSSCMYPLCLLRMSSLICILYVVSFLSRLACRQFCIDLYFVVLSCLVCRHFVSYVVCRHVCLVLNVGVAFRLVCRHCVSICRVCPVLSCNTSYLCRRCALKQNAVLNAIPGTYFISDIAKKREKRLLIIFSSLISALLQLDLSDLFFLQDIFFSTYFNKVTYHKSCFVLF